MKKEEWWIFTFCNGRQHAGYYVKIRGSYGEAREKMVEKYGLEWAFQYSLEEWERHENDPNRCWLLEKELEVIP